MQNCCRPDLNVEVVYPSFDAVRVFNSQHKQNPYPDAENKLIFLTVARLTRRKGHDTVLKILAELKEAIGPFHYYIIGRGDSTASLKHLSQKLKMDNHVTFLQGVEDRDLGGYYHFADFFIMLSRKSKEGVEGFGLTYIEANASGTLCIGSSHGGAAEAINQDVSGIKISETDTHLAAREILKLVKDKAKCQALAQSGIKWVRDNFSGEKFYNNMKQALTF